MSRPDSRVSRRAVYRCGTSIDGRAGFRLRGDWGHVGVLEGGGHIAELNLNAKNGLNPLWRPPWKTIDPHKYRPRRDSRVYGPLPDGRLLAGIAGQNLSFDYFGPPSRDEVAAGRSTHGEAPSLRWAAESMSRRPSPTLCYGATLPESQIRFTRRISVECSWPVVYCEETAENLSSFDRPISWNEHVTFGPPFLECETAIVDMPAIRAKACPPAYSSRPLVKPGAEFQWPLAPAKNGGKINLRTVPKMHFEHYTAQLLDPARTIAFTSACNPRLGLLVVYIFRRADFPWVGNWVERYHQTHAPWSGRTFCRGVEFSTTPFAIPRRETVDQNRLFGERVYRWLPARAALKVRYMILLFEVASDFRGVADVVLGAGWAHVAESGPRARRLSIPVADFL